MSSVTPPSCSLCLTSFGMLNVGRFASIGRGELSGLIVRMGLTLVEILLV